jgi:hypothetical protein
MKKLTVTLIGILAATSQMPALAGPNWDVIHEAEARHLAHHAEEHVLPLDHGPRAITTPWLNKVHEREEAHVAATHVAHGHLVALNTARN